MEDPDADSSSAASLGVAMDSPVTASLGPVRPLLRQLRSLTTLGDGVGEDEVQRLTKDLDGLCISLLRHSELGAEETLSSAATSWMSEVRELCYDTKNYLDDAQFISKQVHDAQLTPEEKQKIALLKFKALKDRANHASKRRQIYAIDHKSINKSTKLASTERRLRVHHPKLFVRVQMEKLATLLSRDEDKQLKVVSLVGVEGVGKTTLAKKIYHHAKTGGEFQCGAFVRVSPNPDMRRLLTTIFTQIQSPGFSFYEGVSQPPCRWDAQDLITKIKYHMRDRRYLIVIDDLWSISVWDIIRRAFPDSGCHSKIITTTQFGDVASACCSYQSKFIFRMEPLNYDQSQKLFFGMVFGTENKDSFRQGFKEVSSEIIEKCGGLPLSIVNIASLLPTEESELNLQQWKDIRDSLPPIFWRNPTSQGMEKVINLIYNNLSPEMKTCLLYLAVYPEGYTSSKDDLVKQWVTEGFTGVGKNKEEIAREYFDELVSRGMIQVVDSNHRGVLSCTLHHTVHDLIVKKSMEGNLIIGVDNFQSAIWLPNKVRRLSVQFGGARSARIPAGVTLSDVRSLAFFGFYGCMDFIECNLLRVLILHVWTDQDEAPFDLSGISELFPLRYVKITCNIAIKLPAKIQNLQFLETLEVDTPVVAIPSDIGGLSRLSSLKIAVRELSREEICIFQKLPALIALSLHVCTTLVKMIVFDEGGFLVLKSFEFRCLVPWLKFEAGSMPDLRNVNLCFNAREADEHRVVPIGMDHLSGLKEITAHIWGSGTDVGSTFRTAINNHPSNPRFEVLLVDPIFHGDATTSVGTIEVEDEKKQIADIRMSKLPPSKRMSTSLGSSSCVPVQGAYKKPKLEKDIAQRMSELEVGSENEDMDTDHSMQSSLTNIQTDMNSEPGCEDENKQADIRTCTSSAGSSSHVPDSGSDKRSKWKTETDISEIMEETVTTSGDFVKLFQWIRSDISSRYSGWSGAREQELQGEVLKLDERLQGLRDTLPKMYVFLDRAEWSSHEDYVVELLPNLKDAVYDAEDLLDEFKYYEQKVTVEGNANQFPFNDFLNDVIKGSFNEKVQRIQDKLDNLSNQLEKMGLHEVKQRFDKSVGPETTYLLNESEIFGRDMELKKVIGFLTEPKNISGARSKDKIADLHVLPIVGIGGVGKTCLAQHACNHPDIRSHFNLIIWICVSDDFDVMRLTKQALESCPGERPTSDDLGILQHSLSEHVRDKKVLIIIDDLWSGAFKEDSKYWNIFCAPLENIGQKSFMLVTTRSPMVADRVRTMRSFTLKSLKDDAIQNFFKQCIFGSESSNIDPNLEPIGKTILAKLNGSPLAAKTVGLLLRMVLENTCISAEDKASQWNYVLESELWELTQKKTDILPSLQLSYMHLPLHLKRCFAFCAVYRKDKRFQKERLAEIWVAEGFVEPEGKTPAKDIGCQYFEELVKESFFQKDSRSYKIPHLLHDMAKLVSKNDCFIIREKADFGKVPRDVRHLSILSGSGDYLLSVCKHTKLRTLLVDEVDISAVIDHWCRGLHGLRVMCCGSTNELPDSICNLKHLRYLEISAACPFNSLPSAFFYLYSLQTVDAKKCKLETMRGDLSNLISLRRFKSHGFDYSPGCVLEIDMADWRGLGLGLIKNVSDVKGLRLRSLGKISKNQAAELELKNKQRLNSLELSWDWYPGEKDNDDRETEVLQVLQPPTSLKSLHLEKYRGASLPSWFGPQNLQSSTTQRVWRCMVDISNKDVTGIFPSMTELLISRCPKLSSLEQLIQPAYIPAIKKITIEYCESLASAGSFVGFRCLEELVVHKCPNIKSQCLVAPSLKRLVLGRDTGYSSINDSLPPGFGNLADNIECCSLTSFTLRCAGLTSIQQQNWTLPALRELDISYCDSLTSIGHSEPSFPNLLVGGGPPFSSLTSLFIYKCEELSAIDNLLSEDYLPVIHKIKVQWCYNLLSLPVEIGSLSSLRQLNISGCSSIRWPSGLVFPSSLECLDLYDSGDMSACVPGCLENLTSLVSLRLEACPGITVIPEKVWSGIRKSLQQLCITGCPDLVSIGGASAIRKLRVVTIKECPKMEDIKQPQKRGRFNYDLIWEKKSI